MEVSTLHTLATISLHSKLPNIFCKNIWCLTMKSRYKNAICLIFKRWCGYILKKYFIFVHDYSMHGHNCDKGEIWYVRVGTKHVYYKVLTQNLDEGIQCECYQNSISKNAFNQSRPTWSFKRCIYVDPKEDACDNARMKFQLGQFQDQATIAT
jgi:hypothetical protein